MIVKQRDEVLKPAPEGTFAAVCVDEIDIGKIKSTWAGEERERSMVRLIWQIDENDEDGKPFLVKQDYTASLDEKSKLRKHLQSWRGKPFTPGELFGFDLENVVGVGCLINIVHNTGRKGGVFANVEGVMKLAKGMQAPRQNGYIRVKDRKQEIAAPVTMPSRRTLEEQPPNDFGISDDDIPF